MQPSPLTAAVSGSVVLLAFFCTPTVRAGDDSPHVVGDYPAIAAQRIKRQGLANVVLVRPEVGALQARP